jgi:hypothetical protein
MDKGITLLYQQKIVSIVGDFGFLSGRPGNTSVLLKAVDRDHPLFPGYALPMDSLKNF